MAKFEIERFVAEPYAGEAVERGDAVVTRQRLTRSQVQRRLRDYGFEPGSDSTVSPRHPNRNET